MKHDAIIPEDIRNFILQNIDSIAEWEGLLLLRANPQTSWDCEKVATQLYIDSAQASRLLNHLEALGFLERKEANTYCFKPASEALGDMVNRAAELYARYLIPITNLIHSKPRSRVQAFADAFKLRKD